MDVNSIPVFGPPLTSLFSALFRWSKMSHWKNPKPFGVWSSNIHLGVMFEKQHFIISHLIFIWTPLANPFNALDHEPSYISPLFQQTRLQSPAGSSSGSTSWGASFWGYTFWGIPWGWGTTRTTTGPASKTSRTTASPSPRHPRHPRPRTWPRRRWPRRLWPPRAPEEHAPWPWQWSCGYSFWTSEVI